jgi:hypothetical protein
MDEDNELNTTNEDIVKENNLLRLKIQLLENELQNYKNQQPLKQLIVDDNIEIIKFDYVNSNIVNKSCSAGLYSKGFWGKICLRFIWYIFSALYISNVIWSYSTQFVSLYTIKLTNCPISEINSHWPNATSNYYLKTQNFTNIEQQYDWYYGSQWLLFPDKICPDSPITTTIDNYVATYKYCWLIDGKTNGNEEYLSLSKDIFEIIDNENLKMQIYTNKNLMKNAYDNFLSLINAGNNIMLVGFGLPIIACLFMFMMKCLNKWKGQYILELKLMPMFALICIPYWITVFVFVSYYVKTLPFGSQENWSIIWPGCDINIDIKQAPWVFFSLFYTIIYLFVNSIWFYNFRYKFGWGEAINNAAIKCNECFDIDLVDQMMIRHPFMSRSDIRENIILWNKNVHESFVNKV